MDKNQAVIDLYKRLIHGEIIRLDEKEAERYEVSVKTFGRYLDTVRTYFRGELEKSPDQLSEIVSLLCDRDRLDPGYYDALLSKGVDEAADSLVEMGAVIFNEKKGGYELAWPKQMSLTQGECLSVCKILLESRSMTRKEMDPIIHKLLTLALDSEEYRKVAAMIKNELFYYHPPQHQREIIDLIWLLGEAVQDKKIVKLEYQNSNGELKKHYVMPVGLMFSEYYFYLISYKSKSEEEKAERRFDYPTIFRVDRMEAVEVLDGGFVVDYGDKFKEGKFRNHVQFMHAGPLKLYRFKYTGKQIEHILDRFPGCFHCTEDGVHHEFHVEVYGEVGMNIWLQSQGDTVELLN